MCRSPNGNSGYKRPFFWERQPYGMFGSYKVTFTRVRTVNSEEFRQAWLRGGKQGRVLVSYRWQLDEDIETFKLFVGFIFKSARKLEFSHYIRSFRTFTLRLKLFNNENTSKVHQKRQIHLKTESNPCLNSTAKKLALPSLSTLASLVNVLNWASKIFEEHLSWKSED